MTARLRPSARFAAMGTESGVRYLAEARALEAKGVDVVHLEIGEPHFDTPAAVIAAGAMALRSGATHYGPPAGLPELRRAIAADVTTELGVPTAAEHVAVLPGSKLVLFAILLAYVEPGDEVLYFEPGFPPYLAAARMVGAIPRPVPLDPAQEFRPTRAALDRAYAKQARVLVANWPSNPLGTVLRRDDAEMIASFARDRDLLIVSDELYRGLEFTAGASLFGVVKDPARCVLMDGFSKRWAMTGWRLAYSVASPEITTAIAAVASNTVTCAATFTQHAALAVYEGLGEWHSDMLGELLRLRDIALGALPRALSSEAPQAGLYLFARSRERDSRALAARLLSAGVSTMPGAAFGPSGEGHLRITFSVQEDRLREGMRRLEAALS
jgi:aspartate/methionine/tyrosine aminotransferase